MDDNNYTNHKDHKDRSKLPRSAVERILTPGVTANNIIKTVATGIIIFGTIVLMIIFAIAGSRLAAASYLPLATLAASSLSIACIWIFGRPKTEEHYEQEFSKLKSEIRKLNTNFNQLETHKLEIENRLTNVELLDSFETKLANRTLNIPDKQ